MWNWNTWIALFFTSLERFTAELMKFLPSLIGALLVFFIGRFVANLVATATKRILKKAKFEKLTARLKINETLEKGNIKQDPVELVSKFIYWVLMLIVFISVSDILGWKAVSAEISKLIAYLPTVFSAIIIFLIGIFIAGFVRDIVRGATASLAISGGKMISQVVYYLMAIIITLTALGQAGIDTSIITSNLLIIIGAVMATFGIAYGFASRDILANILAGFYGRKMYEVGQVIEIDGIKGRLIEVTSMAMTIETETEKIIIPTHNFIKEKVKIYKSDDPLTKEEN